MAKPARIPTESTDDLPLETFYVIELDTWSNDPRNPNLEYMCFRTEAEARDRIREIEAETDEWDERQRLAILEEEAEDFPELKDFLRAERLHREGQAHRRSINIAVKVRAADRDDAVGKALGFDGETLLQS
jgi:hypothetical protein